MKGKKHIHDDQYDTLDNFDELPPRSKSEYFHANTHPPLSTSVKRPWKIIILVFFLYISPCNPAAVTLLPPHVLLQQQLQGDSLERGPEYSVITLSRMNQSEPNNMQCDPQYMELRTSRDAPASER